VRFTEYDHVLEPVPSRNLAAGERHTVTVTPDGFNWQGMTYPSLSAIAHKDMRKPEVNIARSPKRTIMARTK
jgi:Protein of unknown function (DUF2924)